MAGLSIVVSSLLVFLPTIFAFPQSNLGDNTKLQPAELTRWWEFKGRYTDSPRYFDDVPGCPDPHFYLDCNICNCGVGSRFAACTLMGCPKVPQIYNFGENGQGCPKGKPFYHQCNSCECGLDGKTAACTLMDCIEPPV